MGGCGALDDADWRELIDEWRDLTGEILVFDESKLVDPLVDAWKPNSKGRVPTGGFTVG